MRKIDKLNTFLTEGLESFENDPADSAFQRGYKAALLEVLRELLEIDREPDNEPEAKA